MGLKSLTKRIIKKMYQWASEDDYNKKAQEQFASTVGVPMRRGNSVPDRFEDANKGMNFTVYSATGGKIVQIYNYEPLTDRVSSRLYIVNDKDDLGNELGMIVTRECLTR